MASAQEQEYPAGETLRRAAGIYDTTLRQQVETPENLGKYITIDVSTGDFEIDSNLIESVFRLKRRHHQAATCTLRIGYPAAFSHGIRLRPNAR
jgi:hypothetical protein